MNAEPVPDLAASLAPPSRRGSVLLPDGRRLAWAEWGPEDGAPILLCTGAALGGSLGFGADALPALGLRLLALDRPGLGRSDPHPEKTLASWAADVAALVERAGLREPAAVGFSQGAPFALALAGAGLVRRLAIVSGQDQLDHPALRPLLHPQVAAMVDAVRDDPEGFARDFESIADAEGLLRLIVDTSDETDRRLYLSEPFATRFRQALAEGFARGPAPYVRDLVNALGPWPVEPEAVRVPVDLWYGARDASPTHSPDHGATLAARLPDGTRTLDPDQGGSILWTRAADILARLRP